MRLYFMNGINERKASFIPKADMTTPSRSETNLESIFSNTVKIAFSIFTTLVFFVWTMETLIVVGAVVKGGRSPLWYFYFYPFLFLYIIFCYLSCSQLLSGRRLVLMGLLMNTGLLAWAFIGNGTFNWLLFPIFAVSWSVLCITRLYIEPKTTTRLSWTPCSNYFPSFDCKKWWPGVRSGRISLLLLFGESVEGDIFRSMCL